MDYTEKDFGKILKGNALKMRRLMLKSGTTCMRVYDRNLERFPVTVDLYGPYARITDYSEDGLDEETERVCCDIVSRMLYIQADHVVYHRRPKRVGKEQHTLQGEESLEVKVTENDLVFTVDLTKRIDTGLFLDHSETRMMVGQMSSGCRVLNLFSYTGSFSVYAARGGAASVESVDLSSTYTAWAQKNLADNGYIQAIYPCIAADAWHYVVEAWEKGFEYDLIIFDPPSFSNSRKMDHDFDVQRDYLRWMKVLNALLAKDGKLVFSTNLGTFRMETQAIRGFDIVEITAQVAAPGFTRRLGTARTWLLTKQRDVRITAADLRTVGTRAGRDRDEESLEERMKKVDKKQEEMKEEDVIATEVVAEETAEAAAVVEETVQEEPTVIAEESIEDAEEFSEVEEEDLAEQDEEDFEEDDEEELDEDDEADLDEDAPSAEANEVEDDLLTLRWEDDDIAPIGEASQKEASSEERPRRDRDDRGRGRDDRRPSYGDRGERRGSGDRPERPSYGDRGERRSYGDRSDRPSYGDRGERRPFGDRPARPSYGDRPERRPFGDRPARPSYGDRPERRPFGDRPERPSYGDRPERRPFGDRPERPSYGDRPERKPYGDRPERPSYGDRPERRPFGDRPERPSYGDRPERRPYGDRPERPSYGDRPERRPYGDRPERPSYGDRPERKPYGDRPERPSYGDRPERRPYGDRPERPSYGDRPERRPFGDRPSYGDRPERKPFGDRPSFRDRDERRPFGDRPARPSFRDRDDKPAFERRDGGRPPFAGDRERSEGDAPARRERKSAPKPYGFDKFRQTKTRGEHEDDSFFWLDDDKKNSDK